MMERPDTYRAVVYDRSKEGFWKFSRVGTYEEAVERGQKIVEKHKVQDPDVRIVKQ
jgi:hypothetical protein